MTAGTPPLTESAETPSAPAVAAMTASQAVADLLREYGNAWRADWSDCDGRVIKREMGYLADLVTQVGEGHPVDVAEARCELGLCADGGGHWNDRCAQGYCPVTTPASEAPGGER